MKVLKKLIIFIIIILLVVMIFNKFNVKNYVLKKIYPIKYSEYVEKYAKEYGIDPLLIYSVIKAESNFKSTVQSNSGAVGLMQLMETTAKEVDESVNIYELYNSETNIRLGIGYFSKLLNHYDNNINLTIIAYNAGMGNVDKWIESGTILDDGSNLENVPFKETNNYARKILRDYEIYKDLYI